VDRYPPIEPYDEGLLDVGDGQLVHWEVSGNPAGKPAVILHGGPGGGLSANQPRSFDPDAYLIVQFDQRGCGLSTPHAGDLDTDLSTNTTQHLIADMEQLREHLGIDRWLVWGGSWGVTLGLAYAQQYPERVSEMVLVSVTMTRPSDVHWFAHETGRYYPEQWARFRDAIAEDERGDLVAAYDRLINHTDDPDVRTKAAIDWCDWEDALLSLEDVGPRPRQASLRDTICFARLVTHYFHNAGFLDDDQLLRDAGRLHGIPGVLLHGHFDLSGPADVPWLLAQAWPDAELQLFRCGHIGNQQMGEQIRAATERFKSRR
jgi:proline iminopeptidase